MDGVSSGYESSYAGQWSANPSQCLIARICWLSIQGGKTTAMQALEGDRRYCFFLLVRAGVDLDGVDLHHKSDVSFYFASIVLFPFFSFVGQCDSRSSSLNPSAKCGSTAIARQ